MSAQFNIADAKARFSELVQKAMLGEEVIIAKDNKPVAKLVPLKLLPHARKPGSAKGRIWMAPDFDQTPDDFKDYL
jgi:prevent-host-death family protein